MINSELYTKKGQPRKRKPKTTQDYFNEETEQAIIDFTLEKDTEIRNKIYTTKIHQALYKLSENIIHTFKYYYNDTETVEEMKHELIIFILSKLHLYDQTKGKAYSYFGTAAKRYMIRNNMNNYAKLQEKVNVNDFEEVEEDKQYLQLVNEAHQTVDISKFMVYYTKHVDDNLDKYFHKDKDKRTADAILELFRKCETLDIFNKKALYIYIREQVDVDTPQITRVTNILKKIYNDLYNEYYENGEIR